MNSSLTNALRMLKLFTADEPEHNIRELAGKLGIGKSTAHRLLSTLVSEGFVTKEAHSSKYQLSGSILALGHIIISNIPHYKEILSLLEDLVGRVQESAHLAILSGAEVLYLHKVDCDHPTPLLSHIGKRNPIHCTSTGQAMLAFQPVSTIETYLSHPLKAFTKHTVTDPIAFQTVLSQIRTQGYAISKEEMHLGVISLAAPIRDQAGQVVASITLAGPIERINRRTIPELVRILLLTSSEISSIWGKSP